VKDIEDLDDAIASTQHNDIRLVYGNLRQGSYNHFGCIQLATVEILKQIVSFLLFGFGMSSSEQKHRECTKKSIWKRYGIPDPVSNLPILILDDIILKNIYPQEELAKVITKVHRSYRGKRSGKIRIDNIGFLRSSSDSGWSL
jgi:hypothetical protein